jgi:hypothetical protein
LSIGLTLNRNNDFAANSLPHRIAGIGIAQGSQDTVVFLASTSALQHNTMMASLS